MTQEFGAFIKNARLKKDLSLRDLASLTGLDHSYIGRLEKGGPKPSRNTVIKLAEALNIPEDTLLIKAGYAPIDNPRGIETHNDDEPTPQEIEEVIRTADLQFDGAPLDDEDKEDIIGFIRVALKAIKKRKREQQQ